MKKNSKTIKQKKTSRGRRNSGGSSKLQRELLMRFDAQLELSKKLVSAFDEILAEVCAALKAPRDAEPSAKERAGFAAACEELKKLLGAGK